MSVEQIPVRYRRPRQLSGAEIWDSPQPSDLMVWEVCPYTLRPSDDRGCKQCPEWEEVKNYGKGKRGCRGLAEEVCRIVMAVQRREATSKDRQ